MILSKSDYLLFLAHPAWLWLKKNDKDKLPPVDENLQQIFDRGHAFESYANSLFPEGVELGFDNFNEYKNLPGVTGKELEKGTKTIFQGRFETKDLTCIVDILDRVKGNTFDLIEVKSSTQAKPEHIPDLAFQTIVLEKSGMSINNISVMHVNNQYVKDGAIEADQLIARTEVTDEVRAAIPETMAGIERAQAVMELEVMPDISPRYANPGALKDWLEVLELLKPDLAKYSIYRLAGRSISQILKLEDDNITTMDQIPDEFKLSAKQRNQVKCVKSDRQIIEREPIKSFLDTLIYPLYFLDYETLGDLIPPFDGMKPYQQLPFQYSLHVIQNPGGEEKHFEFLHQENTNPGIPFTKQLQQQIGSEGTVLVWNEGFEKNMNLIVAEMLPDYKEFYNQLNERIVDLMTPFMRGWLVDKDFFGSASIKKVQPVLAPELQYKELDVSDGMLAQRTWMSTFLEGKNEDKKEEIVKNLLKYCGYDTLVMVKIYRKLMSL